jgi:hypothetical protein
MPSKITTYRQDRTKEWLRVYPRERWRCDIFPEDGSDHHGIGETEAAAIYHASISYLHWIGKNIEAAP